MLASIAVVDATRHTIGNPFDTEVTGLGLLERTLRLAAVVGCEHAVVTGKPDLGTSVEALESRLAADDRFELEVSFCPTGSDSLADAIAQSAEHLAGADVDFERLLYLDSTAVYDRNVVDACLERLADDTEASLPDAELEGGVPRMFAATREGWNRLATRNDMDAVASVRALTEVLEFAPPDDGSSRPWFRVTDVPSAARAERFIWKRCYKAEDGPVGRYINRPISLLISERLAPHDVTPNQISIAAGLFGVASGPIASTGGYTPLLVAAIFYQIKSILDGSDGEIARAKYEYTDVGAWIDKIFDDLSDISFTVGGCIGVWSMGVPGPVLLGPEFWFVVIAATLLGKVADSAVFYGNAYRDGTLVHPKEIFDWWFEDASEETSEESMGDRILAFLKPVSRADVFTFIALVCAIAGVLPTYLALFAVGQISVAVSRIRQARLQKRRAEEREEKSS